MHGHLRYVEEGRQGYVSHKDAFLLQLKLISARTSFSRSRIDLGWPGGE